MSHIVVYSRKTAGNPIVGIHAGLVEKEQVDIRDVYPGADPEEFGVVVVPEDVISQMTEWKYKRDRKGKLIARPVHQEKSKDLTSVADSSMGENILIFGEPYAEIAGVTNLAGTATPFTALNPGKGVIGVGSLSGQFAVTCRIATATQAPEILAEEKNWEWELDKAGNIVGMRLLKALTPESQD